MNGPFRGSEAIAAGVITRDALRTRGWRRLSRDVYVDSEIELTHLLRCRAAALVLPVHAAISGRSAAHLHGAEAPDAAVAVEVTVGRQIRPRAGVSVRRAALASEDIVDMGGLAVTTPARTAFDLARWATQDEAIVAIDALLHRDRLSVDEAVAYTAGRPGWPGASRARRVLALVARGAESPMESRLRLLLVRAGLPPPVLQHLVCDERGFPVARLDMAYVAPRLGVEYDGEQHFDERSARRDVRRQNALRALGWSLLRFNADDVLGCPSRLVAEVRAAMARL